MFSKIKQKALFLLKASSFKNVLVLSGGTAAGQAIVMLLTPVLTRIYSPGDFGALTVYSSIIGILVPIVAFKYELAIPIAETTEDATALLSLGIGLSFISSIVYSVLLVLGSEWQFAELGSLDFKSIRWFIMPGLLLGGIYQVYNYSSLRVRNFTSISRTKMLQGISNGLISLLLGIVGLKPHGLIIGGIAANSAGVLSLAKLNMPKQKVGFRDCMKVAYRYRRFPIFSGFSGLINGFGLYLPPLMVAWFIDSEAAGHFQVTQRVMGIPLILVGVSISQIYYSAASECRNSPTGRLYSLFKKTLKTLVFIGVPAIGLLALAVYWGYPIIFGPEWVKGREIVLILAPMYICQFIVNPVSQTLNIVERQDLQLALDSLKIIGILLSFLAGKYLKFQYSDVLLMLSLVNSINYIIALLLIARTARRWEPCNRIF